MNWKQKLIKDKTIYRQDEFNCTLHFNGIMSSEQLAVLIGNVEFESAEARR